MTINLGTDTLSNNFGGEYKVLEHLFMHSGKGPGTRSLLGDTGPPRWSWEDAAQAKENDNPVRELLLEFANKAWLYGVEFERSGIGTKMMIDFFPPPTSSSLALWNCRGLSAVFKSGNCDSRSSSA